MQACFLAVTSQVPLLGAFPPAIACATRSCLPPLGSWVLTTQRRFPPLRYAHSRTRPIHPVQPPPLYCGGQMQPSYCFQGCHPYSPISPHPLRSRLCFHTPRSGASGLVRGRFPCTQGSPPRHIGWRPPSSSHRSACAHLSERYLAHADYSCRRGSSGDSTAQGVIPDFIHPPFGPTGLPPGRFVPRSSRRHSDRVDYFVHRV